MAKRQLEDSEKKLILKSINAISKEVEWLSAQTEYYQLQISKLLRLNYERTLEDFKDKLVEANKQITQHRATVGILNQQMSEGVEIKETKEESEQIE